MGKEIARLDWEEKRRRRRRAKEIARADPQSQKSKEEEEILHGEVQMFVKTCGGLWG